MKVLISILAACFTLAATPAAMAAMVAFDIGSGVVLDDTDSDILGGAGNAVSLNVQDIENDGSGTFHFFGSFQNMAMADAVSGAVTVIQFEPTSLGSIANLVLTFYAGVTPVQSFQITDANGNAINNVGNDVLFSLNLLGSDPEIWFEMSGVAVPSVNGINPGIQMNIIETPLPAALPFFLTGLAGFGVTTRRRKKNQIK